MKTIIRLLILSAVSLHTLSSWATECRVNSGFPFFLRYGVTTTIQVEPTPILEGVYSYGDIKLECRFSSSTVSSSRLDYIKTKNGALSFPFGPNFTGGLLLGGSQISQPIPSDLILAALPEADRGPWTKVNITPYISPVDQPQSLSFSPDMVIANLQLYQDNSYDQQRADFNLKLVAKNSITFWPNTCTINGGSSLDVDFGNVVDSKVSTDPTNPGAYSVPKTFNYSCSDKTVTQAMGITLQAPRTASFDNRLIGTGNPALGVSLVKGRNVVGVNSTYNAQMVNGDGTDTITFNLVRNPDELPATGEFSGTAVLQIGLP